MHRYLVEIIALTFDADFVMLYAALYDDDGISYTNTTLSASERADLLGLSHLVSRTSGLVDYKHPICRQDKHDLQEAVLGPGYGLHLIGDFALDLIGWYSGPLSCPVP